MKKITLVLLAFVTLLSLNSCKDNVTPTGVNYVSFESSTFAFGVDIGSMNTRNITIYAANKVGIDRTVNVNVVTSGTTADAASYTVPTTVTIPANSNVGTLSVTVSDINIGAGKTIELAFGEQTGLFTGGNITLSVNQVCPTNEVTLRLTFDNWPEEAGYRLTDSSGATVESMSAGAFSSAPDGSDWSRVLCLADGTYTFTITDSYGDGGTAVQITTGSGVHSIAGNSYTSNSSVTFTLP
ncbi:MAG: hypothetical protein GKR88_19710 [Flavobacteriaceae bacterium]|nr:MAG: hypothetical protein GKR88_19710 [Flavobacteriaceae bacterium]